jgi:flagellar motor component MotA
MLGFLCFLSFHNFLGENRRALIFVIGISISALFVQNNHEHLNSTVCCMVSVFVQTNHEHLNSTVCCMLYGFSIQA